MRLASDESSDYYFEKRAKRVHLKGSDRVANSKEVTLICKLMKDIYTTNKIKILNSLSTYIYYSYHFNFRILKAV